MDSEILNMTDKMLYLYKDIIGSLSKLMANEPLNLKDRKTARTLLKSLRRAILEWEDRV